MGERKLLFLMNAEQAREFARLHSAAERGDGAANGGSDEVVLGRGPWLSLFHLQHVPQCLQA